ITARDNDGGPLTYSATGLPSALSINASTGLVSGTIGSTANIGSPYLVTVTATHGTASSSQTFYWWVMPLAINNPGNQRNAVLDAPTLPISATGPFAVPLTYTATGLPTGLAINSSTGVISGTISQTADAGSPYTTTVTVSDGRGASTSTSFTWTVTHIYMQ